MEPAQQTDGVLGDTRARSRVDIGRRAHLQRHPDVTDVVGKPPEGYVAIRLDGDIVHDPNTVTEAVGVAPLQRLPDRGQPERLAGVDRVVPVRPLHVLEGIQMAGGREACLRAGDVETDDAPVPPSDRGFSDLQRSRRVAHGGDQRADRQPGPLRAGAQAVQDRLDHRVERKPTLDVQLWSKPDLSVDDAVRYEVFGALTSHPSERVRGLHDPDGMAERLQIAHE